MAGAARARQGRGRLNPTAMVTDLVGIVTYWNEGVPRAVIIHADITAEVAAERKIRRLNQGLEHRGRRIEALRRIDASIAFGCDLRQTLGMVIERAEAPLGADGVAKIRPTASRPSPPVRDAHAVTQI